jgi:hypothetical protein
LRSAARLAWIVRPDDPNEIVLRRAFPAPGDASRG